MDTAFSYSNGNKKEKAACGKLKDKESLIVVPTVKAEMQPFSRDLPFNGVYEQFPPWDPRHRLDGYRYAKVLQDWTESNLLSHEPHFHREASSVRDAHRTSEPSSSSLQRASGVAILPSVHLSSGSVSQEEMDILKTVLRKADEAGMFPAAGNGMRTLRFTRVAQVPTSSRHYGSA
jgi:hypothetical protein